MPAKLRFRGVRKVRGRYEAKIGVGHGRKWSLGSYLDAKDAGLAYQVAHLLLAHRAVQLEYSRIRPASLRKNLLVPGRGGAWMTAADLRKIIREFVESAKRLPAKERPVSYRNTVRYQKHRNV